MEKLSIYGSPSKAKLTTVSRASLIVETKPRWKFTLMEGQSLVGLWKIPPPGWCGDEALPKGWTKQERKVFHFIRQVFGAMCTDKLQYAVFHTYEQWWFFKRPANEPSKLCVSVCYERAQQVPSVLQAVAAIIQLSKAASPVQAPAKIAPSPVVKPSKKKEQGEGSDREAPARDVTKSLGASSFSSYNTKGTKGKASGTKRTTRSGLDFTFSDIDLFSCSLLVETRLKVLVTSCSNFVIKVADPHNPKAQGTDVGNGERGGGVPVNC
jgi:hypothetical protein